MGGSQSSTVINALSTNITNVAMNIVQSCVVNTTQSQNVTYTNSGLSLGNTQSVQQQTSISSTCFSDTSKETQLQNSIIQAIAQSSTSNSIALIGAFGTSTSQAQANLTNVVKNNITMANIQKNYNTIMQTQSVTYSNSGITAFNTQDVTQGAQVFAAATLKAMDDAGIMNTISSYVDQTSTATQTNPLQFLVDLVGSVTSAISSSVLAFIFIIGAIFFGISYMGGPSADEPESAPEVAQEQVVEEPHSAE